MLKTENLKVYFTQHKETVKALDGVDIFLKQGMTTAIAGESGCGKTTLARTILSFHKPYEGKIYFKDKDITLKENRPLIRRNIQIVFQNPFLSVDPRYTVFSTLYEAATVFNKISRSKAKDIIIEALKEVELDENILTRYPHQLSGGQLQRVCIARALINKPPLVILDEPTSALDIVTASKIMELLQKIQQNLGVTFVFISHNLRILGKISDFCFIMYYGKIIEYGPRELIFKNPVHPYTKLLMKASYYNLKYLEDKRNSGRGCPFMPRCPLKTEKCEQDCQEKEVEPGHFVSCHLT